MQIGGTYIACNSHDFAVAGSFGIVAVCGFAWGLYFHLTSGDMP